MYMRQLTSLLTMYYTNVDQKPLKQCFELQIMTIRNIVFNCILLPICNRKKLFVLVFNTHTWMLKNSLDHCLCDEIALSFIKVISMQ